MTAPNMLRPTTVNGKTATLVLTTSAQTLLNNAASSGKVLKVNMIWVTNNHGTTTVDLTLNYYPQDDIGGTAVPLASTIAVPADAAIDILAGTGPLYLEEDRSLGALCSANSSLVALVSYEEIS